MRRIRIQQCNVLALTGLGSEAVAEILLGAAASPTLTSLDVSQNRVSDHLPAALLMAWPPCRPPLTHLNMGFNRIQVSGLEFGGAAQPDGS